MFDFINRHSSVQLYFEVSQFLGYKDSSGQAREGILFPRYPKNIPQA